MRGGLAHRIAVTSAGRLNPYALGWPAAPPCLGPAHRTPVWTQAGVAHHRGDGPIDLFERKDREGLGNALSRVTTQKGIDNGVEGHTGSSHPIDPLSLLNILRVHPCFFLMRPRYATLQVVLLSAQGIRTLRRRAVGWLPSRYKRWLSPLGLNWKTK